jgi:predicted nucleotidyltransferase
MNNKSLDISGKIDLRILQAFVLIADVSSQLGIPFFVAGATARDIILTHVYDIDTWRATLDIDLGVQVSDWEHYHRLTEALIETGRFRSGQYFHKLIYDEGLPIDFVPFGAIADSKGRLTWPPEHEAAMNTLGFEESYRHSLIIRLRRNPNLEIRFASIAGQALMKIISWQDRGFETKKDAQDLALLIRKYAYAGNQERLYSEEAELMGEEGFDSENAGARLLGRDIAAIANPASRNAVLEILNRETGAQERHKLSEDMTAGSLDFDSDFERNLRLLEKLKSGILDAL